MQSLVEQDYTIKEMKVKLSKLDQGKIQRERSDSAVCNSVNVCGILKGMISSANDSMIDNAVVLEELTHMLAGGGHSKRTFLSQESHEDYLLKVEINASNQDNIKINVFALVASHSRNSTTL